MLQDSQSSLDLAGIIERFRSAGEYESAIIWARGALLLKAKALFHNTTSFAEWYRDNLHIDAAYVSRAILIASHLTDEEAKHLHSAIKCEVVSRAIKRGHDHDDAIALGQALSVSDFKAEVYGEQERVVKRLKCPTCGSEHEAKMFEAA